MCRPASLVLTQNREFWSQTSNSHEDIIQEHGLYPDGKKGPNVLQVEIAPEDNDYDSDIVEWVYKVDQDILPAWADAEKDEQRARKALEKWKQYHCCQQDGKSLVGGFHVAQKSSDYSTQTASDESVQIAGYRSTQIAGGLSTQTAKDESTQTADFLSTQTAGDESTQTAGDESTQKAGDESTQKAGCWSTQEAGNKSMQKAGEGSVQITRWIEDGILRTATRTVTKTEADRWYKVSKGVWTPCEE